MRHRERPWLAFVTTKAQSIGGFHEGFVDGFISRKFQFAAGANEIIYPIPLLILIAVAVLAQRCCYRR